MLNFALTGVAGYIAPRHLKAIKETGNRLVACCDPHDSVGILDQYFPNAAYFKEIERFDRHLDKLRRFQQDQKVNFLSICSPNFLHDAHVRLAFRNNANSICEKPLVLNPWNLDALSKLEEEYSKKVFTILQLRLHSDLRTLKNKVSLNKNKKHEVILTYISSRGIWYDYSWKGSMEKSGGITVNIGVHFFDLLLWLFGNSINEEVYLNESHRSSGFIEFENANVKWFLSISKRDLPLDSNNKATYRAIIIDGKQIEFTDGFTDLHTLSYSEILNERGFGLDDSRNAIELVYRLRNISTISLAEKEKAHPMLIRDNN